MTYERIMGLDVTDELEYQNYRDAMLPILHSYGGEFGFDFKIAETLLSKTDNNINRVFTISFPSKETMNKFFSDPDYVAVQQKHLVNSVGAKTVISLHEKDA